MLLIADIPTPFDRNGRVDLGRLRAHVLLLAAKGIEGFVPTGVTGEFLYLSDSEREAVHRTVLDAARGLPVYPFTWDPNPSTTRYLSDAAASNGASGVVLPPPLFYPLDDDGLRLWFANVAEQCSLPVIAFHSPKRIPTPIRVDTYQALREQGLIAGMMDGSGDPYRLQRACDADPGAVYAAADRLLRDASHTRFLGGLVSSIANLWPSFVQRILREQDHDLEDALISRLNGLERAGGLRAIKALLNMGHRSPLGRPDFELLADLPDPERD